LIVDGERQAGQAGLSGFAVAQQFSEPPTLRGTAASSKLCRFHGSYQQRMITSDTRMPASAGWSGLAVLG
jgi:hypothetical protein